MRRGKSPEEALKIGQNVRLGNLLYLPASNYGADYVFYRGAELIGKTTDKWIPDSTSLPLHLLGGLVKAGLRNAVPFAFDAQTEGWEEYFQEYIKQEALGDYHDNTILMDAFSLGMFDAAAYSIIGSLLNMGIRGAGSKIYSLTPQGRAETQARKTLLENIGALTSNIQDIQKLSQQIQQGSSRLMMLSLMTPLCSCQKLKLMRIPLRLWG